MQHSTKTKSKKSYSKDVTTLHKITESEELLVTYQEFHGSILAVITNLKDRQTHAYGRTKRIAYKNAIKNYRIKYDTF